MITILLVEDDEALIHIIEKRFREEGYRLIVAKSAAEGLLSLKNNEIDLALIDIGLPDQDGFHVAREIQDQYHIPFVFLTAMGSPEYRLEGYELGAADYVPKPFHFKELLLRVEKLLGSQPKRKPLSTRAVRLLPESRDVVLAGNRPIRLTKREFSLLYSLIDSSPRIISREEVVAEIWKAEGKTPTRAVDNTVLKLRQTLGDSLSCCIRSIRGAGYQWQEAEMQNTDS